MDDSYTEAPVDELLDYQPLATPVPITDQEWPVGTRPLVSICCTTYNHVNFIRDAIEGFLMQETTFPVEILIHDDASTDGTAEIVKEYEASYSDIVKAKIQVVNQYSKPGWVNAQWNFPRAKGAFYALCEGDDYWTSRCKLENQKDLIEKSPGCHLAAHALTKIDPYSVAQLGELTVTCNSRLGVSRIDVQALLKAGLSRIPTASVFVSADAVQKHILFLQKKGSSFVVKFLGAAQGGYLIFDHDSYGCYRVNAPGSHTERVSSDPNLKIYYITRVNEAFSDIDRMTGYSHTSSIRIMQKKRLINAIVSRSVPHSAKLQLLRENERIMMSCSRQIVMFFCFTFGTFARLPIALLVRARIL